MQAMIKIIASTSVNFACIVESDCSGTSSVAYLGGGHCAMVPPFAPTGFFFTANFSPCKLHTTCEKSYPCIHTLAMDGLWHNFEVGKAFDTACMNIGPHRTCDRDGHSNALTIFGRKWRD
jgi:hypothetical protein